MSNFKGVSPIIMTLNNATSNANVFQYSFPSGSVNFKNNSIALQSVIIPYSWYNITSAYNNNSFQVIYPDGASTITKTYTLPDGFYQITDINNYLQAQMIAQGYFLVNAQNQNVYYIEIVPNGNLDKVQINCYQTPTSLPTGYAYGSSGTWGTNGLPSNVNQVPQIVISASNTFSTLIGFSAATYPSTATQTSTYSATSTIIPQLSNVASLICTCSLVNNILANPANTMNSIPITSTFGSQIIYAPTYLVKLNILDGNYNQLTFSFFDNNLNALKILDENITINLLIFKD